jgi:MFS family permease
VSDTQPKAGEANGGPNAQPRGLGVLLWSTGVSALGDGAFIGAAPLLAAALTADPKLVAAVSVATYAPWLLVGPFAGALIDRFPRRGVLIGPTDVPVGTYS